MTQNNVDDIGWIKTTIKVFGGVLLMHFLAGIWWAATVTANVQFIKEQLIDIKTQTISTLGNRLERAEARILNIERKAS